MNDPDNGAPIAPEDGQGAGTTPADGGGDSWLATIPETETFMAKGEDGQEVATPLRDHPKLKEFKSPAELAKSLLNAQQLLGKKTIGLTPLKEDASDEEKAEHDRELRRVLNVPEKPEGYEFKYPEGAQVDKEMEDWFRQSAHKHGVAPGAAQGLAQDWAERVNTYWAEEFKKQEVAEKENLERITQHFGGEEKTAAASELAKRGFEATAKAAGLTDEEMAAFRKVHGNDMTFVRLFNVIGARSSKEDSLATGSKPAPGEAMSTEEYFKTEVFKEAKT